MKNDPDQGSFHSVLIAQLVSLVVAAIIGLMLGGLPIAMAAGYGVLIMLIVNGLLARRIKLWSQQQSEEVSKGEDATKGMATTAIVAGRFLLVAALLANASFIGLWLPAVAGGMLVAQIALYLAGFWLLVGNRAVGNRAIGKNAVGETAHKGNRGETL